MRIWRIAALTAVFCSAAAPALADLTGFIGTNVTPANRVVRGVALGVMFVVIGFEFEYADTAEDLESLAPSLRTGMGSLLVQTPVPIKGLQFYGTVGGGIYRETLETIQETHVGANMGGGVKIKLADPLRLRIDYRVFTLRGEPLHNRPQRLYAGLTLVF